MEESLPKLGNLTESSLNVPVSSDQVSFYPQAQQEVLPKKQKLTLILIIVSIVLFIFASITTLLFVLISNGKIKIEDSGIKFVAEEKEIEKNQKDDQESEKNDEKDESNKENVVVDDSGEIKTYSKEGLLAWVEYSNSSPKIEAKIWQNGNQKTIVTIEKSQYPSAYLSIHSIIDKNEIYFKESGKSSDYTITRYNLNSNNYETVYSGDYVAVYTGYDSDTLFLVKDINNYSEIEIVVYKISSKTSKTLVKLPLQNLGRGVSTYDSLKLDISPDKSKFFYINSTAMGTVSARETYIFSLKNNSGTLSANQIAKISNSTHPTWKSNDEIIYQKMENDKPKGVYLFSTNSNNSTLLDKMVKEGYNFSYNFDNQKLLYRVGEIYEEGKFKMYIYDFNSQENTLLQESGSAFWVNEDLAYMLTYRDCNPSVDVCEMSNYVVERGRIITVNDKKNIFENGYRSYSEFSNNLLSQ